MSTSSLGPCGTALFSPPDTLDAFVRRALRSAPVERIEYVVQLLEGAAGFCRPSSGVEAAVTFAGVRVTTTADNMELFEHRQNRLLLVGEEGNVEKRRKIEKQPEKNFSNKDQCIQAEEKPEEPAVEDPKRGGGWTEGEPMRKPRYSSFMRLGSSLKEDNGGELVKKLGEGGEGKQTRRTSHGAQGVRVLPDEKEKEATVLSPFRRHHVVPTTGEEDDIDAILASPARSVNTIFDYLSELTYQERRQLVHMGEKVRRYHCMQQQQLCHHWNHPSTTSSSSSSLEEPENDLSFLKFVAALTSQCRIFAGTSDANTTTAGWTTNIDGSAHRGSTSGGGTGSLSTNWGAASTTLRAPLTPSLSTQPPTNLLEAVHKAAFTTRNWQLSLAQCQRCVNEARTLRVDRLFVAAPSADKNTKRVECAIHQLVEFNRWMFEGIINKPPVQRLRELCQLGACKYVFPSATHTRFEHSLGVGHLAREWFRTLCKKLGFSDSDHEVRLLQNCVTVAGLLHDVGHGPYSHTFEKFLVNAGRADVADWRHEVMSMSLVDYLFDGGLGEFVDEGLDETACRVIKTMIKGLDPRVKALGIEPFEMLQRAAYDIVANNRNGLDADRFDYLQRDSRYVRLEPRFDSPSWLVRFSGIANGEICFNDKMVNCVQDVYTRRAMLFKNVYTHKKVRAMELMLCDAFKKVDDICRISAALEEPDEFLQLTDCSLVERIRKLKPEDYSGEELDRVLQAQFLVSSVTRNRSESNMYRFSCAYSTVSKAHKDRFSEAETCNTLSSYTRSLPDCRYVRPDDIIVDWTDVHFGTGSRNPLQCVPFYSAQNETVSYLINDNETLFYPRQSREWEMRVYCKQNDDVNSVVEAFEVFKRDKQIPSNRSVGFEHISALYGGLGSPAGQIKRQRYV